MERWEGELRQIKRDGSEITVASRWTRLRDRDGKFAGWLESNTDITARKRAEDAARRLSGRILSLQDDERRRIARELHDSLGQSLLVVKNYASRALNVSEIPDKFREQLRQISENTSTSIDEVPSGAVVLSRVDVTARSMYGCSCTCRVVAPPGARFHL